MPLHMTIPGSFAASADFDFLYGVAAHGGEPNVSFSRFERGFLWSVWRDSRVLGDVEAFISQVLGTWLGNELRRRLTTELSDAVRHLCPPDEGYELDAMCTDTHAIGFRCCLPARQVLPITMRAFPNVSIGTTLDLGTCN
jgi:hypothetical protein